MVGVELVAKGHFDPHKSFVILQFSKSAALWIFEGKKKKKKNQKSENASFYLGVLDEIFSENEIFQWKFLPNMSPL